MAMLRTAWCDQHCILYCCVIISCMVDSSASPRQRLRSQVRGRLEGARGFLEQWRIGIKESDGGGQAIPVDDDAVEIAKRRQPPPPTGPPPLAQRASVRDRLAVEPVSNMASRRCWRTPRDATSKLSSDDGVLFLNSGC